MCSLTGAELKKFWRKQCKIFFEQQMILSWRVYFVEEETHSDMEMFILISKASSLPRRVSSSIWKVSKLIWNECDLIKYVQFEENGTYNILLFPKSSGFLIFESIWIKDFICSGCKTPVPIEASSISRWVESEHFCDSNFSISLECYLGGVGPKEAYYLH